MKSLSVFLFLCVVTSSCVVNKRYQLLQKGDVNIKNIPPNKVVRSYEIEKFDYKIQANDVLLIKFESLTPKEFDFLSKGSDQASSVGVGGSAFAGDLVDENGEVPFPVLGKVKVAGMTVFEIQEYLQTMANKYLESAIVKVRLLNYRISFLGEVNREATISLPNNRVNFLEALALNGGLTDLADRTSIKLIRQQNNKTEIVYINLLDENFLTSPYYYVHQNDIVIVPALKQRTFRKYFGNNFSLLLSSLSLLLLVGSYIK